MRALVSHTIHSFQIRKVEWLSTFILISLGCYVLAIDRQFISVASVTARSQGITETTAAYWMVGLGFVRLAALVINGWHQRTPYLRGFMSFICCGIWLQISQGAFDLEQAGVATFSIIVFPWLLMFDLYNAYQAGNDSRHEELKIVPGTTNHVAGA